MSWNWSWQLGLASFLATVGALCVGENRTVAQIAPDTTLGSENSTVTSTGDVDAINGGATRGANLFHSFQEFNVNEGRAAVFTNPAGIENILTRVTGANPSNILGTLGVAGNANLFLINPNGIIFGQNARLDVGGSFVATTANAISFGDRGVFSATNPSNPGLLTVNPSALLFNQIRAAAIQNNSIADSGLNPSSEFTATGLRVPDGNSLLLVGGDLNITGGGLYAFGGRVELGGLASAGTVGLNGQGNNLSLSFTDGAERSDVFLSKGAGIDVTASAGGSIAVNARNLKMTEGSYLFAGIEGVLASENSKAGNIDINATGAIDLNNKSMIANQVLPGANGQGGNVNISASNLRLESGAQINAFTLGAGKGGNLTVDVSSEVQLIGTSTDSQSSSSLTTSAQPDSTGDAGDLNFETSTLRLEGGAQVSAVTFGAGKGGNLNVVAHDMQLSGTSNDGRPSGLSVSAERNSTGDAGNLTINTHTLWLEDGAQISAATFATGRGGNLNVVAHDMQLSGTSNGGLSSGLFTSATRNSTGDAGNLTINTGNLLVQDGARVSVESSGTGTAGNMTLNARSIRLNNNAELSANTQSALVDPDSEQATINISSQNLFMSGNSNIFTNAKKENVIGGNINIDTDLFFAVNNSDISANSKNFRGGNVRIDAFSIFGTQFRAAPDDRTSDITASGANPQLSGSVEIDTPGIDPNRGLVNLPSVPVDTQLAQNCNPSNNQNRSEFIVTGRGGLPPNPTEVLSSDATSINWVALRPTTENQSSLTSATHSTARSPVPIVEATGWELDRQGKVILTASRVSAQSHNSWQSSTQCKPR
ncbi:MAG: hypothetical protein CLLPBCKN_006733 [Chroococcidiopsis cubana SAG 39.79]|uniref:Filamentous haemagglutinin FhaB/tRNA nuclease CdiA-like TPS domain-containing protein n=1 Tax=Chroococcidiopsis cubana SAG 39.79 TaxID=388085 RepID=A0AB37UCK6_9CYAN|nr:filamentous hemagglutinin N-terminal domain-containing protein [Chroococcidiopsis cubana]MDZ4877298.1 hypothetical protein [Chroococcidiopsis cubana SAG 39.79]PSB61468.1 hypothetical protein C7B79_21900 [Chroococcidiopsis cubana CCALA 043]RUT05852.1 hypothetical protein DSM107010_53820 [Chroococcidiopsis cubana SAG 39.79]